jgi:hypothetical protein
MVFCAKAVVRDVLAMQYVHFERPKLGLALSYEYEEESRRGRDIRLEDTSHELRERADIETGGWVYHPKLFIYRVRFQPAWKQIWEERLTGTPGTRESGTTQAYLPGYFLDFTFLQAKPYTLHLFARRSTSSIDTVFAEKSETEVDTYGGDVSLNYGALRTTLSYRHYDSDQRGYYRYETDGQDLRLTMRHHLKSFDTRVNAAYSDETRTTRGTTSFLTYTTRIKNAYSTIHNTYDITGDRRVILNSFLSHRWWKSDYAETSGLRISERLRWKHMKNLRSHTDITYNWNEWNNNGSESIFLDTALTHTLYENLTTTVGGRAELNNFEEGSEWVYEGRITSDYRRKIPWGTVFAGIGYDYEVTNRSESGQSRQVTDESHRLRSRSLTLLDNERIDVDSIRVTDTSGGIVYNEDVDYRIVEEDDSVRISRTTFGGIADGQTVLVSYSYLAVYDDAVLDQSYRVGLNLWSLFNIRYEYRRTSQSVLSGNPPDMLVNDAIHRAEIRADWRWTHTRLWYEDADRSFGISTRTWLLEQALEFRPVARLFMRFSGRYQRRRFKESNRTEDLSGLRAKVDWMPLRWLKFELKGYLDRVTGTIEETVDMGISGKLKASYRIWSATLAYKLLDERDDLTEERRRDNYVGFEIIRRLW